MCETAVHTPFEQPSETAVHFESTDEYERARRRGRCRLTQSQNLSLDFHMLITGFGLPVLAICYDLRASAYHWFRRVRADLNLNFYFHFYLYF